MAWDTVLDDWMMMIDQSVMILEGVDWEIEGSDSSNRGRIRQEKVCVAGSLTARMAKEAM